MCDWWGRRCGGDRDVQGTGCYRDETRAAVLALPRGNGIEDSGLLGPKTWVAAWQGKPPTG